MHLKRRGRENSVEERQSSVGMDLGSSFDWYSHLGGLWHRLTEYLDLEITVGCM